MMLNMMYGANIPYPYNVPNITMPDGTLGIWALIGATEGVDAKLNPATPGDKNKIEISCGSKREDEK